MPEIKPNKLVQSLADVCRERPLIEKLLIAPTYRIGHQWLDQVTNSGQPVLNVRVTSLQNIAHEIAVSNTEAVDSEYLNRMRSEMIVGSIFHNLKKKKNNYLLDIEIKPSLIKAISAAINDLRIAGLNAEKIKPELFEVETKGIEIKSILSEFENELHKRNLIDYPGILNLAIKAVKIDPSIIADNVVILIPEDIFRDFRGLEKSFFTAIPEQKRIILKTDSIDDAPDTITDANLMCWINKPTESPPPKNDGTAKIYRAIGEINEFREVLRRCVETNTPFDNVEILHTDPEIYIPIIYETALLMSDSAEQIPFTFMEGIPIRYSRPGKALLGWVSWIRDDFSQSTLARLIEDGNLTIEAVEAGQVSYSKLSSLLKVLPIGSGRNNYLPAVDSAITALENKAKSRQLVDDDEESDVRLEAILAKIIALKNIRLIIEILLSDIPTVNIKETDLLEAARLFLENHIRANNKLDENGRNRLIKEIKQILHYIKDGNLTGLNALNWLSDLPHSLTVMGLGPRPGCIYVAPLSAGGHSGRQNIFIIGIDDSRFPGSGLQDPLLLDKERNQISKELSTSASRSANKLAVFEKFIARIRGNLTLSYCCHDLRDDREMFPSPLLLSAYRILSGKHDGVLKNFLEWLPPPASFAPNEESRCISSTELWLSRMCSDKIIENAQELVSEYFPNIGWGLKARDCRDSDIFTEYDGYVPEAGKDCDPAKEGGHVLSASRLEKLAACPLEYFFSYILEIEPPEEFAIDPGSWLDGGTRGNLLHEVFRDFMATLNRKKLLPEFARDIKSIESILRKNIDYALVQNPHPNKYVIQKEIDELYQTVRIFLKEEEQFCKNYKPVCFESSIGMPQNHDKTFLDIAEPVSISLSSGKMIKVRGRIDRIDQLCGIGARQLSICDYKTGSAWKYNQKRPYFEGRCIQNILYVLLVKEQLRKVQLEADVTEFIYYFPNSREHGTRIVLSERFIYEGKRVLEKLCDILASGCFSFTDDESDLTYSEYTIAYGDVKKEIARTIKKLETFKNKMLAPFQSLRKYIGENKND